jgi:protein-S-isoprenylcysteine O-methyltransferase Ste14
VRTEEQMMVEAFGKDYQEYIQRSGRFLPRVTG